LSATRAGRHSGDIVSIRAPGEAGPRAGIVLGRGDADGSHIIALMTEGDTLPPRARFAIIIGTADVEEGQLPAPHIVRVDDTVTLGEDRIAIALGRLARSKLREVMRAWAALAARNFSRAFHADNLPAGDPLRGARHGGGAGGIPYAGRVFTEDEVEAAVSASLDFWLTLGPEGEAMERELAEFLGVRRSILVNSGSSANLLAMSALTSHTLATERRLRPGDEVITCAAGFPTTVAPIIQAGATAVFIDADPVTLNARVAQLEEAYVEGRTRAIIMAHALGNPFDLTAVEEFCRRRGLWLIEDNCDALGSTYDGRPTGGFGDLSSIRRITSRWARAVQYQPRMTSSRVLRRASAIGGGIAVARAV